MTPYQKHVAKWKDCHRCPLCKTRSTVVLARGKIPAQVLFIGEAPGASEDFLGKPFCGPAGKLLDSIIEKAIPSHISYCLTNLVACLPLGEDGNKTQEPPEQSIFRCAPRLKEIVRLVKPELIVRVGNLAKKHVAGQAQFDPIDWLPENSYIFFCDLYHPAAILRMDVSQKGLAIQRTIVTLHDAIEEL